MKGFAILTFSFILAISAMAQTEKRAFDGILGLRAAVLISHPNFAKGSPPSDYETSFGVGYSVGIFLKVPLTHKLSIQPEYLFSHMHSDMLDEGIKLSFDYLSLPVLIKYQITDHLALFAGPQFDLLIRAERSSDQKETNLTHEMEARSIFASLGLEYSIIDPLSIGIRYLHGFNHIGLRSANTVEEFKFEAIQISAAFGF